MVAVGRLRCKVEIQSARLASKVSRNKDKQARDEDEPRPDKARHTQPTRQRVDTCSTVSLLGVVTFKYHVTGKRECVHFPAPR